jgi:predicted aspartyl protease
MKLLKGTFLFDGSSFCAVQVFDSIDINNEDDGYRIGEEYIDGGGDSYIILKDSIADQVMQSQLPQKFFYE